MNHIFRSLGAKTGLAAAAILAVIPSTSCETQSIEPKEEPRQESKKKPDDRLILAGPGFARTSVNSVPFRHNSIVTEWNIQYITYYSDDGDVMIGKRTLGEPEFAVINTGIKGGPTNAHNNISIMVDGLSYIHLTVNFHNGQLNYYRGDAPGSLNLVRRLMIGDSHGSVSDQENQVTYTEFYRLPSGDLLFVYRNGTSGNGDLVLNRYDASAQKWTRVHTQLVWGANLVSPYWQMYLDTKGTLHLSWVFRRTGDAGTNSNMYYAYSADQGETWQRKSDGQVFEMPITPHNAEIVWPISEQSNLINTTSMTADQEGNPYIATYWSNAGENVNYRVIYHDGKKWNVRQVSNRKTTFSLSGSGTLMIPVARPRIVDRYDEKTGKTKGYFIFRDAERGYKASMYSTDDISSTAIWKVRDLTDFSVYAWEPTHDTELWKNQSKLHVFIQYADQVSGDRPSEQEPMPVYCLEVDLD